MNADGETVSLAMLLALSVALVAFGGYATYEQTQGIRTYQPTEATVVSSQVTVDTTGEDVDHAPDVTYRYTVDGTTYTSADVLPGPGYWFRGEQWARTVVEEHPEGATVTAYYDPANPSDAFLVKETSPWPPVFAGVGVLLGVLGIREVLG